MKTCPENMNHLIKKEITLYDILSSRHKMSGIFLKISVFFAKESLQIETKIEKKLWKNGTGTFPPKP